jgi:predicted nucleic-acid-binding protein
MIAVDTNVLARILVRDDLKQAATAERLLGEAVAAGEACFVSDPVLCELVWVLESCYGATRPDVVAALQSLLEQEIFLFEDQELVRHCLQAYHQGRADFADYLIGAKARARGARTTFTFDRVLARQEGFSLPESPTAAR